MQYLRRILYFCEKLTIILRCENIIICFQVYRWYCYHLLFFQHYSTMLTNRFAWICIYLNTMGKQRETYGTHQYKQQAERIYGTDLSVHTVSNFRGRGKHLDLVLNEHGSRMCQSWKQKPIWSFYIWSSSNT